MNSILDEINEIYKININTTKYLKKIKEKYKNELKNFEYADNINDIIQNKNIFIRYINVKGKLYYGGIYYKTINKNNKFYILLINKFKKIWEIAFDDHFIFYTKILNDNDNKREFFKNILEKFN
jgi:hypothetical protein